MTADEAVVAVLDALETSGVPYMIVGSLASNFHGIPRSTRDADFVVEVPPGNLAHLGGALPPGLTLQQQGSFEAVTGTTRYLIELADSPFVCELFVCSDARTIESDSAVDSVCACWSAWPSSQPPKT